MIRSVLRLALGRPLLTGGLAAALFAGTFAAGTGTGMWLQSLRESKAREALAVDLAACRGSQADAAIAAAKRQTETTTANLTRMSGLADRLDATANAFDQINGEPREVVYRAECLSDRDDERRMRELAAGDPDH
jgi:hypothetical protein